MNETRRSYIVAATPRTGSSLLCEGLAKTGVAGCPAEVFAPDFRGQWYRRWGLSDSVPFSEYLSASIQFGTTPNGIYGMKIQWMHVPVLAANVAFEGPSGAVLDQLFPDARFVNIVRRDRRAQALSWFRAWRTNEWFRTADNPPIFKLPDLEVDTVRYLEEEIVRQQSAWLNYFAYRKIQPLVIEYETLECDYRAQVARVLEFLGLDVSAALRIPNPSLMRQADEANVRWREAMDAIK